jgi:hypothetical protein
VALRIVSELGNSALLVHTWYTPAGSVLFVPTKCSSVISCPDILDLEAVPRKSQLSTQFLLYFFFLFFFFVFFVVMGLELGAYTLSRSTSPIFCDGFFSR